MAALSTSALATGLVTITTKLLAPLAEKVGSSVKDFSKETWAKYMSSFEKYLNETENRHRYFSSQVFSNEGSLLSDYYIPLKLIKDRYNQSGPVVKIDSYPADLFSAYKDILIVDTAGMGKSTLLKFIFLEAMKKKELIPIFIELRKLSKKLSLKQFILNELSVEKGSSEERYFEQCIKNGTFLFLLDGFDEIPRADKKSVSTQIIQLKSSGEKNKFVLSSREEQSLAYLEDFRRFHISPLKVDEAYLLIKKLAPSEISTNLISKLKKNTDRNLADFLRNPLLVSLLTKSFLHSPILPVRLSEFYRQVFDALFQSHDARKDLGGFSREKESRLDLDRFHKALRALGVLTYKDRKLEFTTDELLASIEKAKILTADTTYSASSFLDDLLHAVPLFTKEGTSIRWTHRSLQEYFAAAFICLDAKEKQETHLRQLYRNSRHQNSNLLRLCADIDEKTFKNVLIKDYLESHPSIASTRFAESNFPNIPTDQLNKRRSLTWHPCTYLICLRVSLDKDVAKEKINPIFKSEKLSGGTAFEFITPDGAPTNDAGAKIKYILLTGLDFNKEILDSLIADYFHVALLVEPDFTPLKKSIKNVPFNELIPIDDHPDNPLNNFDNFDIVTRLLINENGFMISHYDTDKLQAFCKKIQDEERDSNVLTIDFA
jgi:hypothetical protein